MSGGESRLNRFVRASCLLADDHPALLVALSDVLWEAGFSVVGPAQDGESAIRAAAEAQPELAVVDYRMPRCAGVELVRRLLEVSPHTRIAVYTADADLGLVEAVLEAGAAAVVLKEAPLPDLLRALDELLAGGRYLDPALASLILEPGRAGSGSLTARELEVLRLLSDGLSHEAIGKKLEIRAETVRSHARKAAARLGARTRTQAVASAIRLGLIS